MATDLLAMPTRVALFRIAWPVIALGLVRSGYFLADAFWAGRMGEEAGAALSAMGGAAFATWILSSVADLSATGTHALVARAAGAGDRDAVRDAGTQGTWLALALGIVVALAAGPLSDGYFALVGFRGEGFAAPLAMGRALLRVLCWGFVTMTVTSSLSAVFRGLGDTRTPMIVSATTLVLNAALAPVLMFGLGPVPRLGLPGAAWATVIASAFGAAVLAWALAQKETGLVRKGPSASEIRRIAAIGFPQAVSNVGFSLVYVLLGDVLASFGPAAIAGLGIGHRVESASYQVCLGFGTAAATLVGQNLGAGDRRRAAAAAHRAARLAAAAMIPFMIVFVLAPRAVVGIWAHDPATLANGAGYLLAAGAVLIGMSLEVVYESAFAGAGDTMPAMVVVLPLTVLRIPVAAWLAANTQLGISAIWWAIAATTAAKGLLLWVLFAARTKVARDDARAAKA
jgi:putative MATE family efflux protein